MIDIDGNMENSDWIKSRHWNLPTTIDGLLSVIGFSQDSVEKFLALPAAKPMPKELRIEVYEYLKDLTASSPTNQTKVQ